LGTPITVATGNTLFFPTALVRTSNNALEQLSRTRASGWTKR
jgi:hypothetical protein